MNSLFLSIIYDKSTLISYGKKYPLRNLSIFEDARISFFFASKGKFLENQEANISVDDNISLEKWLKSNLLLDKNL